MVNPRWPLRQLRRIKEGRSGLGTVSRCGKQVPTKRSPVCGAFLMGGTGLEPVTPSLSSLTWGWTGIASSGEGTVFGGWDFAQGTCLDSFGPVLLTPC
jgi:hypothetical protein